MRLRGSTEHKEQRENSAGVLGNRQTGAKRMTGLVTRDSAQRRPIDKHRLDARTFLHFADRLSPTRPTGCRRALTYRFIAGSPTPPRPLHLAVLEAGSIGARAGSGAKPPRLLQRSCSRIR